MKNYNIINLSIADGLSNVAIGTAGDYIKLLEAPTSAAVTIRLNDRDADPIPLKAYHSIEASNVNQVYVSCNAVAGETIKIVQAKSEAGFKINTPVSDIAVDEIGGYSATALASLSKIIEPYQEPTIASGSSNNTALTTLLSETANYNKVVLRMSGFYPNRYSMANGLIFMTVNGDIVASAGGFYGSSTSFAVSNSFNGEIHIPNGATVEIKAHSEDSTYSTYYSLEKYTLKP